MAQRPAAEHRTYFDLLAVVACLAVVVLHCTLTVFGTARDHYFKLALVLQGVCIFAVPVFFMMSGANCMRYRDRYGTREFFRRRLARVGVGLLVASTIIYLLYRLFPQSFYGAEAYAEDAGFVRFVGRLATNTVNDVYWFIYTLFALYLLTPLLSLAADRRELLRAYLALSFCAAFAAPLAVWGGVLPDAVRGTLFSWPLLTSTATFYYVLGYYLARWPLGWRGRACALVAGLAALVAMGWLAWSVNAQRPDYDASIISANSAFAAVYAAGVFELFQGLDPWLSRLPRRVRGWLSRLSGATFFVYLFHVPLINWVGGTLVDTGAPLWNLRHPLLEALGVFCVTMALGLGWQALRRRATGLWRRRAARAAGGGEGR